MYSKDYIVKASLEKIAFNQVIAKFENIKNHEYVLSNKGLAQELRTIEAMLVDAGIFENVKKWVINSIVGATILLSSTAHGFYIENPEKFGENFENKINKSQQFERKFDVKVKVLKDKQADQKIIFELTDDQGNKAEVAHDHQNIKDVSKGIDKQMLSQGTYGEFEGDSEKDKIFSGVTEAFMDVFEKNMIAAMDDLNK